MTFPVGVELEIDGTWTDVSARARMVPPTISRGRADEQSQVAPTSAEVVFDNTDGALTPNNPTSIWYPHIKRGLPARVSVEAGDPYLLLSGAAGGRATTPDNAALDITGDLFMAVELQAPVHLPAAGTRHEILAKWNSSTNQRSYHLGIDEFGRVVLFWSTNGTAVLSEVSTVMLPLRTAGTVAFAVWLDVNVSGTDRMVTFYTASSIAGPWSQLGFQLIDAGTTSIFNSTSPLEIGDITGAGDVTYPGGVRRAQVRSGDQTGTVVANPDFTTQTVAASSFTDSAGRVWSVQGDAKITNRQTRFCGAVAAINLDWPKATRRDDNDPGVAQATFTLAGPLRRLNQGTKPLQSSLRRLIGAVSSQPNVIGYWPCEDGPDSTRLAAAKPAGGRPMRIVSGIDPGSDSTLAASEPLPTVTSGTLGRFEVSTPVTTATSWVVEEFCRLPTADASPTRILGINTSGTALRWLFHIDNTPDLRVIALDDDGATVEDQTAIIGADTFDHWFLFRFQAAQNGGNVDWSWTIVPIPEVGFSPTGGGDSGSFAGTLGRPTKIWNRVTGPTDGFSFGHIVLQTGLGLGWLAGADTAWAGETAAHRVWRLCREEQIPVTVIGDQTLTEFFRGNTELSEPMGAQLPKSLPELLQECADTDLGILYEVCNGVTHDGIAFRTHTSLHNQDVAVTLDLAQNGLTAPFEPALDDQRLRNTITVSRTAGSSTTVFDEDSVDSEGLYDNAVDVNVATDEQTGNQAGWRLHMGTWPETRFPAFSTSLLTAGNPVLLQWLNADLGDRFTATNLMRQYDETVDQLLEGYQETLSVFQWETALNGSPAGMWEVGVRDDDERGKRDTAGTTLTNNYDTDDTVIAGTVNVGPVWSVDAADCPLDINVGGERMTVSNIDLFAGSVYLFDVTRSVNGIVKSHTAGTPINLWRPTVRAL